SRVWVAIVEFTAGKPRVNVFHTGTKVLPDADGKWNTDFAFTPTWMHLYEDADGKHDRLWIGTYPPGGHQRERPLEVDLHTLAVRRTELEFAFPQSEALISRRGELWVGAESGVVLYAGPGKTWPHGETIRNLCTARNDKGAA